MEATKRLPLVCSQIIHTKERQHALRMVGKIMVLVSGPDELTDEECLRFIEISLELSRQYGAPASSITYSPTQVPSAKQRTFLADRKAELLAGLKRSAIVTDSAIVRGGVTALGWIMREAIPVKMFHSRDIGDCVSWTADAARQDTAATYDALCEVIVAGGYRLPR